MIFLRANMQIILGLLTLVFTALALVDASNFIMGHPVHIVGVLFKLAIAAVGYFVTVNYKNFKG